MYCWMLDAVTAAPPAVSDSTVEIGTLLTAIMVRDVDAGESGRGSVCGCRR
jgi:hypothetical protein